MFFPSSHAFIIVTSFVIVPMTKVQQYLCELEAYNTLVSIGSVLFQVRLLDSNVLCDQRGVTIAAWWISGHDKFLFM